MKRNIAIFIVTFVAGAIVAFAARTVLHEPTSAPSGHSVPERTAMVSNTLTPATKPGSSDNHAGHGGAAGPKSTVTPSDSAQHDHAASAAAPATVSDKPVNTVCAICGMEVDPKLPTLEYQGQKIGFGCKLCPPKFRADPDKYGPLYLRNEVVQR
jgi:hypothetical protein